MGSNHEHRYVTCVGVMMILGFTNQKIKYSLYGKW